MTQPAKLALEDGTVYLGDSIGAAGEVDGATIKITKGITLQANSGELEMAYMLEGLPPEHRFHFGIELNFAGLPPDEDDRYFYQADQSRLGHFGEKLDMTGANMLGLADHWLWLRLELQLDQAAGIWAFPIETVSQSESGYELVHQSVSVNPHWLVTGDSEGRWVATMRLLVDTSARPQQTFPGSPTSMSVPQ